MSRVKMTPSEALVETLVAEGVNTVFGIVGSAYMDALDLFPAGRRPVMQQTGWPVLRANPRHVSPRTVLGRQILFRPLPPHTGLIHRS